MICWFYFDLSLNQKNWHNFNHISFFLPFFTAKHLIKKWLNLLTKFWHKKKSFDCSTSRKTMIRNFYKSGSNLQKNYYQAISSFLYLYCDYLTLNLTLNYRYNHKDKDKGTNNHPHQVLVLVLPQNQGWRGHRQTPASERACWMSGLSW